MKKRDEHGRWTPEFKHKVCKAFIKSNRSKVSIWRQHTGQRQEHGSLTRWLRELGYVKSHNGVKLGLMKNDPSNPSAEELDKILLLEKRLAEMEARLKDSEMKALAFSTMIDIAEKTFKIPIRKKFDSKPSKK